MKGIIHALLVGILLCSVGAGSALGAGICARVVIRIEQEMTLEREGFEARLTLDNGLPSDMEEFSVVLNFTDADGKKVDASTTGSGSGLFYYRVQTGYTLPKIVPSGGSQKIAFLIVPAPGAAGESAEGAKYFVGATVKYKMAGTEQAIEVDPDSIQVRPMPQLQLQYFLPRDVYGDDPMTAAVEPVIPYAMGVRVCNHSPYAAAKSVAISSSQPEIVENEKGLLIDFQIIGCEVNGGSALPSLDVNFGKIAPQRAAVANWWMTSSLSGKFVKFTAEVTHAPEFGGALTSLIPADAISTHRLLGRVLVDLPGSDKLLDFLGTDSMSGDIALPKIFESDTDEASSYVDYFPPGSPNVVVTGNGSNGASVAVSAQSKLLYVRTVSPVSELKDVRAFRSDGKELPASNCWISKNKNDADVWVYWLNIFDTNNLTGAGYSLTFVDPVQTNRAPVLTVEPGSPFQTSVGRAVSISVTATDPDGTIPSITTGLLPDGAVFTDMKNGKGQLVWKPLKGQEGTYTFQLRASDGRLSAESSVTVQVSPAAATGFAAWQERFWPGITDPSIIGPEADPDGDQMSNLMEYALDANPTIADESTLPRIGTVEADGQRYLTLTYCQRLDDSDLKYEVVASESLFAPLDSWTVQSQLLPMDQTDVPENLQRVQVCDEVPINTALAHRYLRLRVSRTQN